MGIRNSTGSGLQNLQLEQSGGGHGSVDRWQRVAIDHPRHAKLIGQHSETSRPKGFPERYRDRTADRERPKNPFRLGGIHKPQQDRKAFWGLIDFGPTVRTHQFSRTNNHAGVTDFTAPFRRHRCGVWCVLIRLHGGDFSAQAIGVKPQGRLAIAIEKKVRAELNTHLLSTVASRGEAPGESVTLEPILLEPILLGPI